MFSSTTKNQQGFTIIEVLITLGILSLFLFGFFQSYLLLESQRINVVRQAKASDIAYTNLRLFPIRPSGVSCDTATMDLTTGGDSSLENRGKSGQTLIDRAADLGASSKEVVKAFAPNGCDGTEFQDGIVKIESTVTYGSGGKVVHASYVR